MNHTLHLPELLSLIFGYLDIRSQHSCALVCKGWSSVALDVLWKELDSPKPLVSLLGPLQLSQEVFPFHNLQIPPLNRLPMEKGSRLPELQRAIRVDDWKIFNRYARRVRTLNLDFLRSPLSPTIYSEMAQKRPTLTILPNLTRLKVRPADLVDLVHPLLFMGENVRELLLNLTDQGDTPEQYNESVSEFFGEVATRIPNLKVFELCAPSFLWSVEVWSVRAAHEQLVKFLASMKELDIFKCALYFATSTIITALSQLPALRFVVFDYPEEYGIGQRSDVIEFHPSLSPGAFPALIDMSFSATFKDASSFLQMDFAPKLTMLYIHSPELESAESLRHIILSLSQTRQRLTNLCLSATALPVYEPILDEAGQEVDRVTLATLLPLLDFPGLRHFEISYHRPFQLSNSDLRELLLKWRALEVLHLCSDPLLLDPPVLTSSILPMIAECCPKIRDLSLYLDTHVAKDVTPAANPVHPTRFASLKQIEFGTSPLAEEDIQEFALLLCELLSPTCKSHSLCGVSWIVQFELAPCGFGIDEEVARRWDKTAWTLSILIEARERERARVQDLEREAKDLAMRVAVLEEQRRLASLTVGATSDNGRACVHQ